MKATKCCGKETRERTEEVSTKYCSNILNIITLAFIALMAATELQIVNDLQQNKENILSLSNFTIENRNSGYTLVYRDKAKLEKLTLLSFTQFGFGLGPEFSSDIAGDGPKKRIVVEDDYDPEQERIKKKKAMRRPHNLKRKRSKAERKTDNLKQNAKRSKAERKVDNLKQNKKRKIQG